MIHYYNERGRYPAIIVPICGPNIRGIPLFHAEENVREFQLYNNPI
jgi:hypothetical protein